jgi:hypothetical protein
MRGIIWDEIRRVELVTARDPRVQAFLRRRDRHRRYQLEVKFHERQAERARLSELFGAPIDRLLTREDLVDEMHAFVYEIKHRTPGYTQLAEEYLPLVQRAYPARVFTLQLSEQGQDGKIHTLFQDCEVWGKKAEDKGELDLDHLVIFKGKLARRKKGENWETVVAGFELTAVLPPVATSVGSSN